MTCGDVTIRVGLTIANLATRADMSLIGQYVK
jgi:hypothetical protein